MFFYDSNNIHPVFCEANAAYRAAPASRSPRAAAPKHSADASHNIVHKPLAPTILMAPPDRLAVDGAVAMATAISSCIAATPSRPRAMPTDRKRCEPNHPCRHDDGQKSKSIAIVTNDGGPD